MSDESISLTPVLGNPFSGPVLTPVDGDPFQAAKDYANTIYEPNRDGLLSPDYDASYGKPSAPIQTPATGLAAVAGDPSRSMWARVPAAVGSAVWNAATGLAGSAWSAATLPGDVATGKVDPNSLEAVHRSADLAGLLGVSAPESAALTPVEGNPFSNSLASKTARMYNAPMVVSRPFDADYPTGVASDASGNLTHDIEGRPFAGGQIVGRRVVGGDDEALSPTQSIAAATAALGGGPQAVASRQISGDAGRLVRTIDPETGSPRYDIAINRSLTPEQGDLVANHEFGHAIDLLSGQIPTEGLNSELRGVYNTMNNPQTYGKPYGPENSGYKGADIQRELMAEAVRAYMSNPNYLKTAAPKTAAAIRAAVNSNPRVNKSIQFNSGAGVPISLTAVAGNPFSDEDGVAR